MQVGACEGGSTLTAPLGGSLGPGGSPYRVTADLRVDDLTIQPGVTVCFDPGTSLHVTSSLVTLGTAEAPVLLTARAAGEPWGGIRSDAPAPRVELTHTTLSEATHGVALDVFVDPGGLPPLPVLRTNHVTVRDIEGTAIAVRPTSGTELRDTHLRSVGGDGVVLAQVLANSLTGVSVDSVCLAPDPAAFSCAGVSAYGLTRHLPAGDLALDGVTVAHSGEWGLDLGSHSTYTLADVAVLESAHGVQVSGPSQIPGHILPLLTMAGALRVSGIAGVGASGTPTHVAQLRAAAADGIDGDFRTVGSVDAPLVVPAGRTWWAVDGTFPSIELQVGSRFHSSGVRTASLHGEGTPEEPVHIEGTIVLQGDGASELAHARMAKGRLLAVASHALSLRDVRITDPGTDGGFTLGHRSSLLRVDVDGTDNARENSPAIQVNGNDVRAEDVRIFAWTGPAIEVSGSRAVVEACRVQGTVGGPAILFRPGSAGGTVTGCSLTGNEGPGIRNLSESRVVAPRNWWGDPAGPTGDGVEGLVDASDPLTEPPPTSPPAAITLAPRYEVTTGDAVWVAARVTDADGRLLPATGLTWTLADGGVARRQRSTPWVEGRGVGSTTLTVSRTDAPAVTATTEIVVLPGAPVLDWTAIPRPAGTSVSGLWASEADAIVVGDARVYRWDGSTWTDLGAPLERGVHRIVGDGAGTLWAMDRRGRLARHDGVGWSVVATDQGLANQLRRTPDGEVLLCSEPLRFGVQLLDPGGIYSLGPAGWERERPGHCVDLWAGADLVLAVVVQSGTTVARRAAGTWTTPYGNLFMHHVWVHRGVGLAIDEFAEIRGYRAWRLMGDEWVGWASAPEGHTIGLHGSDAMGVFSYGEFLYHTDGEAWYRVRPTPDATYRAFAGDDFAVVIGRDSIYVGRP